MKEVQYDRQKAYNYAQKWAFKRNPIYYNFDNVGGDCTSFVSQCIFAGIGIMNYTKIQAGITKMEMIKVHLGVVLSFCIIF